MSVTAHKIQGFKSQFKFTPPGGGSAVQFKSLTKFDIEVKSSAIDSSDHESTWKGKMSGMPEWTGSITGVYVEGDATQQDILTAITGGALQGTFYPELASGQLAYQGSFVVTSYKHSTAMTDAQGLDITIEGDGALTTIAQP